MTGEQGGTKGYEPGRETVAGWARVLMTAGLASAEEAVADLRSGDLAARFPGDPDARPERLPALVAEVAAVHRREQPGPSADARALLVAARTMSQSGIVVSLGDAERDEDALAAAVERGQRLRRTGAMVSGCAYASRAGLVTMVLDRRLELRVAPLPDDEHSALGAQIAGSLGLGHAAAGDLGPRTRQALVDAGLPGRWDPARPDLVVVDPIDFAAPITD